MVIVIRKKLFKLTEVENKENEGDTAPKDKKSMINEILKVPEVKEKKQNGRGTDGCRGLPHGVSDEWFQVILKVKEDKKKKEERRETQT